MPSRNPQDIPAKGKIIAIDFGEKTLGIAISDASRLIASPRKTIMRTKWGKNKEELANIIQNESVVGAVIGLPLNMQGEYTAQTQACVSFADMFEKELNVPVLLWDERLTTRAAESAMFEQRIGRQKRASKKDVKKQVDSVAASLILESALGQLR